MIGLIEIDGGGGVIFLIRSDMKRNKTRMRSPKETDVGWRPLYRAVLSGNTQMAELLIDKGADVNAKDYNGWTSLHWAARLGSKDIVEFLIVRGADINAKNNKSFTPLHCAALWGYKDAVEFLIAKGADINAKNKYGHTPLSLVAGGRWHEVDFLIAQRWPFFFWDPRGKGSDADAKVAVELLKKHGAKK